MAKHDKNNDRHDSKSALSTASHTVSPGKRLVMSEPRGGKAGRPAIKIPGEAVMKEADEGEQGFKRGGGVKKGGQPVTKGKAHSIGPVRPSQTETPSTNLNDEAMTAKKHGGKVHKKDGGEAHESGVYMKRGDRPARKAGGGAATMRGRSPMSSAATTVMPTRANTH